MTLTLSTVTHILPCHPSGPPIIMPMHRHIIFPFLFCLLIIMLLHNKELGSELRYNAGVNAPCTNTVMHLPYRDSIAYTTNIPPFYTYCCYFNECILLLYVQCNVHNYDTPCTFSKRITLKVTVNFPYTFILYFPVVNRAEVTISYCQTDE